MPVLSNRVKVAVASAPGTSASMSLGTPEEGFQSVTDSGVTNSQTVRYVIEDGANFEIGSGVFTTSSNSLTRTVLESTNSNNRINATADAIVVITVAAEDIVPADGGDFTGSIGVTGDITVTGTVDGVDIATRDAVLTSTTTTANNALPKAGGTMTGNLILNGDPTIALQGATKQYVDTIAAAGIHYHQPVRCQATATLTATYNNGSSGVGATLTNSGAQAALVIDGVTVSTSDRVLIQLQTNQAHNGVYTVTNIGSGSTNWVLTRATDADSYAPSDPDAFGEGDAFFVTEGTVHGGELDVMTTSGVITFGTTAIVFALVTDAPIYSAGTGMSLTGTEFSIGQAVGTSDTPTFAGGTFTGDVSFSDDDKAVFGTGSDLQIFHDSTNNHSRIVESGSGNLKIEASHFEVQNASNTETMLIAYENGSVELYENNVKKLETTTSGVDVSGYADVDNGMRHNGNLTNEILFGSNTQTFKTNGSDRIYITNTGVSIYPSLYANGDIVLTDTNSTITRFSSGNIAFNATGAERARVNSDGVTVKTGRLAVQDTSTAGTVRFHEAAAGANYVDVVAPSSLGADYTVTLPAQTGTAMLWQSGWSDDPTTGAGYNIAIGEDAFNSATSGSSNIAIGKNAMYAYTTGQYSVAIGTNALADNQTDSHNVAVGYEAGRGDYLLSGTYVGSSAGNYNLSHKDYQTAIGYYAMNDCSADYTTSVGAYSMRDGNHYRSTAVGWYALGRSSTSNPYYNTAVGSYAGDGLFSGDGNTLVGYDTDTYTYSTSYGVAVGYQPRAGVYSVSIGYQAAYSQLADSNYDVCIGRQAGYDLDGGEYCVFIGDQAGYEGGTGDANTSVGAESLRSLTDGTHNNSLGYWSLYSVTSGDNNSSIGSHAGRNVSTGDNNTLLGYHAGYKQGISTTNALTTGSNVTCVGFEAMPSSGAATNEIVLGDASISSLRCNVQTISSLSDERDKTAIKDLTYGLDFVNDMRPVEFTWNRRDGSLGAKPDMGFIAQELYDTELDHSSSSRTRLVNWENPEKLEADYVRSYPILVKAVQELSAQVTALEARIEALEGN